MKKQYITPATEVLLLQAQHVMAASLQTYSDGGDYEGFADQAWGREDNVIPSRPNIWEQRW